MNTNKMQRVALDKRNTFSSRNRLFSAVFLLMALGTMPAWGQTTVYKLASSLESGKNYLIVSANTAGSAYALGHSSTSIVADAVTVISGDPGDGTSAIYIASSDVDATSVWTAGTSSSYYTFLNSSYYLYHNSGSLSASTSTDKNTWTYSSSSSTSYLYYTGGGTTRYIEYNSGWTLNTSARNVYLFEETIIGGGGGGGGTDCDESEDFSSCTALTSTSGGSSGSTPSANLPTDWKGYGSTYYPFAASFSSYMGSGYTGGNFMYFKSISSSTCYLALPYTNVTQVTFDYAYESTSYGSLQVGYMTDISSSTWYNNTFNSVQTATNSGTTWGSCTADFSSVTGTYYVVFSFTNTSSIWYSAAIDNVCVTNTPSGYSVTDGTTSGGSLQFSTDGGTTPQSSLEGLTGDGSETVTIDVSTDAGYTFESISAVDAGNNDVTLTEVIAGSRYTFTMPASNVTVTAMFTAIDYIVTCATGLSNGSITASPSSNVHVGEEITVNASPDQYYRLGTVTVTNSTTSETIDATVSGNTATFTMPASNVSVTATFVENTFNVTCTPPEHGTLSASPETAHESEAITVTATPNENCHLVWLKYNDGTADHYIATNVTPFQFSMPAHDVTVSALFVEDVNVNMHNGVQDVSGTVVFRDSDADPRDPGDPYGRYCNYEDYTIHFLPTDPTCGVKIEFDSLWVNNDFLYFYDGDISNDNLIAEITCNDYNAFQHRVPTDSEEIVSVFGTDGADGSDGTYGCKVTVSSHSFMTVRFVSDYHWKDRGWHANVTQEVFAPQPPAVAMVACHDHQFTLLRTSKGANATRVQYVYAGGGDAPDFTNPTTIDLSSSTDHTLTVPDDVSFPIIFMVKTLVQEEADGEWAESEIETIIFGAAAEIEKPCATKPESITNNPEITVDAGTSTVRIKAYRPAINDTYLIYYTLDGTTPNNTSTKLTVGKPVEDPAYPGWAIYTGTVTLTEFCHVKAVVTGTTCPDIYSDIAELVYDCTYGSIYLLAPVISFVPNGEGTTANATLTASTEGCVIHYKVNGGTEQTYTGGSFSVNINDKVEAWVTKDTPSGCSNGYEDSPHAVKTYLPGDDTPGSGNSGLYGDVVYLDDREDHSWSYYSDTLQPIRSINPADVKITYYGYGSNTMTSTDDNNQPTTFNADVASNQVAVNVGEAGNTFVYYKTLERTDGGTNTKPTGNLPYTMIPNPFQVRPTYGGSSKEPNDAPNDGGKGGRTECTVNDGAGSSEYVPFHGYYADYGAKSQFIIPSGSLSSIPNGAVISALKFYSTASTSTDYFGDEVIVEVGEVSDEYFSSATFVTSGLTTVYSGTTLSRASDGTMTITFSSNYTYHGGNLLVSIGGYGDYYGRTYWNGVAESYQSVYAYNYSSNSGSIPSTATDRVQFAPKVTLTYDASGVCEPSWGTSDYGYISNFTVTRSGTDLLNNTSSGTANSNTDYYNDDSKKITVSAGDALTFAITPSGSSTYGFAVWIDFDNDGLEASDRVLNTTSYISSFSRTYTIPTNAADGEYRLRILQDWYTSTPSDPCGSYNYGESEDYKLVVSSGGVTRYPVNFAAMVGGSVTASPNPAAANATVTLTVTTNTGYSLTDVTVTNDNTGAAVSVSGTGTTRTFTMPSSSVTVNATFSNTTTGTWRGFYAWRVKSLSSGLGITVDGTPKVVGDIIYADQDIEYVTTEEYGNEVEFEALWAKAYVTTGTTSNLSSNASNSGNYKNAYERNFHVVTSNTTASSFEKTYPLTVSSYYPDGSNGGGSLTGAFTAAASTKFENITISSANSSTWACNFHDLVFGRGVSMGNSYVNELIGTSSTSGTYSSAVAYTMRMESGTFGTLYLIAYSQSTSNMVVFSNTLSAKCVIGSDYDRAKGDNSKLSLAPSTVDDARIMGARAIQCSGSANRNNLTLDWYVKSGQVRDGTLGNAEGPTESIYVGSSHFTTSESTDLKYFGKRRITIEGGEMASVACGVDHTSGGSGYNVNDDGWTVLVRVKGNPSIRGSIYGAAASSDAAGDRRFVLTGGTIGGWIAGGCNGTETTGGTLAGDTYLYIGGETDCDSNGNDTPISSSLGGNVFGAGSGISGGTTVGQVSNSTIVIADNGHVERNVFGGGNYGHLASGGTTNIYILGGIVGKDGSAEGFGHVFGGANQNDGETINIYMKGGLLKGNLFGGSNESGHINGDLEINVSGGTIGRLTNTTPYYQGGNVFGGGWGLTTDVYGDVTINMSGGMIYGSVYGGGELGSVQGSGGSGGTATVNISGGTIGHTITEESPYGGNVFGAGMGKAGTVDGVNYADYTTVKKTIVNVSGGHVNGSVFGGGENGHVTDSTVVTISGGTIGNPFNDKESPCKNRYHGNVYGGGRGIETYLSSGSQVYSKTAGWVHKKTTVNIQPGARIMRNVYGGGDMASVGDTTTVVNGWATPVANTGLAVVNITGGQIGEDGLRDTVWNADHSAAELILENGHVFGSSHGMAGSAYQHFARVNNTRVNVSGSADIRGSVFGGGEDGHVLDSTYVHITGGTIGSPLTAEELQANDDGTGMLIYRGNVFGGGRGMDTLSDGSYSATAGFVRKNTRVVIDDGFIRHNVYGGGAMSSVGIADDASSGRATVLITGGQIGSSGSNDGRVFGSARGLANADYAHYAFVKNTFVTVSGTARVFGSVFGGGENGHVRQKTTVNVSGGAIGRDNSHSKYIGNVYGGGRGVDRDGQHSGAISRTAGKVYVETEVNVSGGFVYRSVYGGGSMASVGRIYTTGTDNEPASTPKYYDANGTELTGSDAADVGFLRLVDTEGDAGYDANNGRTVVNITGGTIGIDGSENGHVFGSARGLAGNDYKHLSYTGPTNVSVSGGMIHGSVFGGGEDGHVLDNANVSVSGGIIGREMTTEENETDEYGVCSISAIFFGNVYGGGRGLDTYEDPENPGTYLHSSTAGWVKKNATVNITGGTVRHNVYGGGSLASVGLADETPVGGVYSTGLATVNITGGTIGTYDGSNKRINSGRVFGSSRGVAAAAGSDYTSLAFVKNTAVTIGGTAEVYGSVFGGGENGHVRKNASVTVSGGHIGVQDATTNQEIYTGNVYGGGRGVDVYGEDYYSATAGKVNGNTTVTITGGQIDHNVYGGGSLASVGDPDEVAVGGVYSTGLATVTITGGQIGLNAPNGGFNNGRVFGSGRGRGGATFANMTYVKNTIVTINGANDDDDFIMGCVFGSGDNGHVRQNTHVYIRRGKIGSAHGNTDNGNVFGGGRGVPYTVSSQTDLSATAGKVGLNTNVYISGGYILHNVYGGGALSSVGDELNPDPEYSGLAKVTIVGGTIGTEGDLGEGHDGGHVFGSGFGRPDVGSIDYHDLCFVKNTFVTVRDSIDGSTTVSSPHIYGSVFGSGENGHVRESTFVFVEGGTIGDKGTTGADGNVYGGGRGRDQNENGEFSATAGKVNINTHVTVSGGTVKGSVFGGGRLASVGNAENEQSGFATVTIKGGTIGTGAQGRIGGNVYGSAKGLAGLNYHDKGYVKNTYVAVYTPEGGTAPQIKGSVFGGGEDGHVREHTKVSIKGGTIGFDGGDDYKGNVYGGGRGIDLDASGNLSETAGQVLGHTRVYINGGTVKRNVYGGGNMSVVGEEKVVNINNGNIEGSVFGGSNAVPEGRLRVGLKTVNMRGGTIGGDVSGCSNSSTDGDPASPTDTTAFVNVSGGTVNGNIHGAGYAGEVNGSVFVNVGANAIAAKVGSDYSRKRNPANVNFDDCGDLPRVILPLVMYKDATTAVGYCYVVDEDEEIVKLGLEWSTDPTFATYSSSYIEGSPVPIAGTTGYGNNRIEMTTGMEVGNTYYVRAYAKDNADVEAHSYVMEYEHGTHEQSEVTVPNTGSVYSTTLATVSKYPKVGTLDIKGSVYAGSEYYGSGNSNMNNWFSYDITGYSDITIDGTEYETTSTTESATNYMNIGGGVFGSSSHCEAGALGHNVLIRNYGTRNTSGTGDALTLTSATRTLTTIQRCENLLLDNANLNIVGAYDLNAVSGNVSKYAVIKVDDTLYICNSSSLTIGNAGEANLMDSIKAVRSVMLNSAYSDLYAAIAGLSAAHKRDYGKLTWDWVGIKDSDNKLYRIASGSPTALTRAEENVILFNNYSKLYVRHTAGNQRRFGELNGFFRMESPFTTNGIESFAYARLKNGSAGENKGDGGFLSYNSSYNTFTDSGNANTNTQQYPYTNIEQASKSDTYQYRLWSTLHFDGERWYVDGTRGWGNDDNVSGRGLAPDMPFKTLYGTDGLLKPGTSFNYEEDIIFVVGALTEADSKTLQGSTVDGTYYPLQVFRYPGGHPLSWALSSTPSQDYWDVGGGTASTLGVSSGSTAGPGANYDKIFTVGTAENTNRGITLTGTVIDGLYGHDMADDIYYLIPGDNYPSVTPTSPIPAFQETSITAPLVVTTSGATLTIDGSSSQGVELKRGFNNSDAATTWYTNSDYAASSSAPQGGALYVDDGATVNVKGEVTIMENWQKKGSGTVRSNVYLPTFGKAVNITGALANATMIGITNPKRNTATNYTDNTFSPVAVATTASDASNAWTEDNIRDDQDWFFSNGMKRAYYDATNLDDKTLYFGWTWNNVVRSQPAGYSVSGTDVTISDANGLAWLISLVNGENDCTASTLTGTTVKLTADLDLQQYVWVPVGTYVGTKPFSGTFDGQGHVISNLDIRYIGTDDRKYQRTNYGLFGYLNDGAIKRTFVLSGLIQPEGNADIGGLVGRMDGSSAVVAYSEAVLDIHAPDHVGSSTSNSATGGLVGRMFTGEVHSSFAMPTIYADNYKVAGGLVGYTEDGGTNPDPKVTNAFAKPKFVPTTGSSPVMFGGLVGNNYGGQMDNCYMELQEVTSYLSSTNFALLTDHTSQAINNCFAPKRLNDDYEMAFTHDDGGFGSPTENCFYFSNVADADTYGYMYSDNKIDANGSATQADTALFVQLNMNAYRKNVVAGDSTYAHWARPGLSGINGDLPVLLLSEFDQTDAYQGGLRSLATYGSGPALQYGGPVRDASTAKDTSGELDEAIARLGATDNLLVYGDITTAPTQTPATGAKISIHEDAAILLPGTLANFDDNYVGVTFDNSSRSATDFYGNTLLRDWHMFSTPLQAAPLGINYNGDTDEHNYWNGQEPPQYAFYSASVQDGYFPSNTPYNDYDFYTWYEPDWQWINFKRNSNSHFHYDVTEEDEHPKITYTNETNLVPGKGYWMSIEDPTFMQSHGQLNNGTVSIAVTNTTEGLWGAGRYFTGNNLIGNPYHAYINFDETGLGSYYMYDADGGRDRGQTNGGYILYAKGGSRGGYYAPQYIHPHQGFFIKTNSTGTVTLDNTDTDKPICTTRAVAGDDAIFRDDDRPAYPLVNLFAEDEEGRADVVVIEFNRPENGGGLKAKALRNGNHLIYAHYGDDDYGAFFAEQGTKQVPVRFKSYEPASTTYTLYWDMQNGDFNCLYLIDNLAGVTYDMTMHDSYTFSASSDDYLSRFLIVFSVTDIEEYQDDDVTSHSFAFYDGSNWVVNGKGRLELFDVTGRLLYAENLHGDQNNVNLDRFAKGVYLLRLSESASARIQKIILR